MDELVSSATVIEPSAQHPMDTMRPGGGASGRPGVGRLAVAACSLAMLGGVAAFGPTDTGVPIVEHVAPSQAKAGNWEWWGYRTNSYQTWALATQSPTFARRTLPYFNVAAYVIGTSWRWNAQGARIVRKCTGITWSTSPIYVGCSSR